MAYHFFTAFQLLTIIANWQLEPFTLEELNFLLKILTDDVNDPESFSYLEHSPKTFTYGQNDPESLILEILSEMDC